MKDHVFVVRTRPIAGQGDAFNEWYNQQHINDVLSVLGVVSARRYKMADGDTVQYLALYNICADDPHAVLREIGVRAGGERMPMSSALDMDSVDAVLFEAIGEWCNEPGQQGER